MVVAESGAAKAIAIAPIKIRVLNFIVSPSWPAGRAFSEVDPIVWTKNRQPLDGAAG
jgi:hypothetical protein